MIHVSGFIERSNDGIYLNNDDGGGGLLAETLGTAIMSEVPDAPASLHLDNRDGSNDDIEVSVNLPKVNLRAYFSDKECSLEEAESNQILLSIGELDILETWYGYSEYTILGYDIEHFELISENGVAHDLEQIFGSYIGKYIHIVVDVLQKTRDPEYER